jgi:hypothetical protein
MLAGGEKEDSGWYDDERLGEGEWRFRTGRSQAGEGLPALGTCGVSTGMRQTVGRGCEHSNVSIQEGNGSATLTSAKLLENVS